MINPSKPTFRRDDFGSVRDGRVSVSLVTPEQGSRAKARVELVVYGARYPYKLSAAEARHLGESLLAAAEALTSAADHVSDLPIAASGHRCERL